MEEVAELKSQLTSLNVKFDAVMVTLSSIQQTLAKQEGHNIPNRVYALETAMTNVKTYQAERDWIPEQVEENRVDIKSIHKYLYMGLGIVIFLQVILNIAGGFILGNILKS